MGNSIKKLKKEINYIFGDVIDEANYKQLEKPDVDDSIIESIIDEAVTAYEDFYEKINAGRKVENAKKYFKELSAELEGKVNELVDKIKAL